LTLKFYNSMGRRVQVFKPLRKGEVRMYTCGPTVWNYAHIGNYRTFVFEDLLHRYLKFKGFSVTQVMNITDVEDNIIKGMKQFNKSRKELTSFYEAAFKKDLATLNVVPAEVYPRATEHIGEMVALIKRLLELGYAYRGDDGSYYYDISKFAKYGALSGIKPTQLKAGARVAQDHYEKEEANDFALWKAWDPDDGEVFWETELGKGRPGWHIECSAMSMKYLGDEFDIHTGAIDNRFPHHENEIAQSVAATGKRFVRYWLHAGFLNISGEEMHKSVGNVVYLSELLEQGWEPSTLRLFLISTRYRDTVDLTEKRLEQARDQARRLQDFLGRIRRADGGGTKGDGMAAQLLSRFERAMDEDLNTPRALAVVFSFVKKVNGLIDEGGISRESAAEILDSMRRVDAVLGVLRFEEEALPDAIAKLVAARDEARRKKDFATADRIREELLRQGVVLEDTPTGTVWKKR
jgi:cysteinyl-tRNA synthetase